MSLDNATDDTPIVLDDMVRAVAASAGTSQVQARRIIKAFCKELSDRLADGNREIVIRSLGRFRYSVTPSHYKSGLGFGERQVVQKKYKQIHFIAGVDIMSKLNKHLRDKKGRK